jgi:hypothetical protein
MTQTSLRDYAPVLAQRDTQGEPFVLVGGQAVNFWADFYQSREPRLNQFYPFLSKDLDLLATTEEGQRVAADIHWDFVPPETGASAVRGKLARGPLLVELLRSQGRELFLPERVELNVEGHGSPLMLRLLNPVVLLVSKLSLAVDVPQDGSIPEIATRQDVRHVEMLGLIMPQYLIDVLARFPGDSAGSEAMQPAIAILASMHRGETGRRFEAAYPHVLPWHALLPDRVRALPMDAVYRRCIQQLDDSAKADTANPHDLPVREVAPPRAAE